MQSRGRPERASASTGWLVQSGRVLLLCLPVVLLLVVAIRSTVEVQQLLYLGAAVELAGAAILLTTTRLGRESAGPSIILFYVVGLGWVLVVAPGQDDWLVHLSQACLLVVPLLFFARQCLRDSGASSLRRARLLASGLRSRRNWPQDLMQCRTLPEVKAFREALHVDASPALELLSHPRVEVRIAALAALEYRPAWRTGQPQVVLQVARRALEPEIRAMAINALANVEDRQLVESLGELLRDTSALVRQTATEALFWSSEQRWHWIRDAVRHALADPVTQDDGALRVSASQVNKEILADFHTWALEKGSIGVRAALTLGRIYSQLLASGGTSDLLEELRAMLTRPQTPPMLRLELARLLKQYRELDMEDLLKLITPTMPAPVRLMAVEALLTLGRRAEAMSALHDLARLPNREIAMATADVVQRCLGIDLGLPRDQDYPPVYSRAAAEIARRVLAWAMQGEHTNSLPVGKEPESSFPSDDANSRVELG